ncbi:unnamed protein product [Calicophoron daubneyi]|uniref:Phospholipid scramblase n=1 Tax=Calicophoron daubneyi TaxID=300641 RepID=A0AAV2SYC8_CALDB
MNGDRRLSHFGFTVEDSPPHPGYPQPPVTENSTPPVGYSQHVQPPIPPQGPYGPGVPRSTQATWMSRPGAYGCPPGLEYLTQVDHLFVKQKKEILEIVTGIETENRYDVLNALGQTVYRCVEEASYFQMSCCGASRAFTMHVYDNAGIEVVRIIRPYKYHCMQWCNCCKCCQDEVEVQSPVGTVAGYVTQMSDGCKIKYNIMDSNQTSVLQLKGSSYCICECWGDMHFQVLSKDGTIPVGDVTKQWSGIVQEYFTDADNFGISFPMDLDVRIKAVLLGAAFLIDFMFFEEHHRN